MIQAVLPPVNKGDSNVSPHWCTGCFLFDQSVRRGHPLARNATHLERALSCLTPNEPSFVRMASPRPVPAPGDVSSIAHRSPGGHVVALQQVDPEAAALKLEMMRLRERRRQLEEHRRALKRTSVGGTSTAATGPAGGPPSAARSHSAGGGGRSVSARSGGGSTAGLSGSLLPLYDTPHDPPGATHEEPIKDERTRRMHMSHTVELEMKEAMKKSWEQDTCLVTGFFLEKQGTKAATFGRAPRFQNPVGMKGCYYLSNDVQKMQSTGHRFDKKRYCVATRGKFGANVNVHWNDSRGGGAPGPGTYTPRYLAVTTTLGGGRT